MYKTLFALLVVALAAFGLYRWLQVADMRKTSDQDEAVRTVVEFGTKLQTVPLTAGSETVHAAMDVNYKRYLTSHLLVEWEDQPEIAFGRLVSSPWPASIEPTAVAKNPDGSFTVQGNVIEITSEELVNGGAARSYAIEAVVVYENDRWRIDSFRKL